MDGRVQRAKKRRIKRRQQIIDAAAEVFSTKGYYNASLNDLLKTANIARGTFYLYFENFDAVFLELVNQLVQLLIEAVSPIDSRAEDAMEQLLKNIENAVRVLTEHQRLAQILLREAVAISGEVSKRIATLDQYMNAMLVGALTKGAIAGWIRDIEHKQIIATIMVGGMKEVILQMLSQGNLQEESPEIVAGALFDYGTKGLLAAVK